MTGSGWGVKFSRKGGGWLTKFEAKVDGTKHGTGLKWAWSAPIQGDGQALRFWNRRQAKGIAKVVGGVVRRIAPKTDPEWHQ